MKARALRWNKANSSVYSTVERYLWLGIRYSRGFRTLHFSLSFLTFGTFELGTFKRVLGFQNNSYSSASDHLSSWLAGSDCGKSSSRESNLFWILFTSKRDLFRRDSIFPFLLHFILFSFFFLLFCSFFPDIFTSVLKSRSKSDIHHILNFQLRIRTRDEKIYYMDILD